MKLSVSLPEKDVAFLDRLASERGETRSAALQRVLRYHYSLSLGDQYELAWREWEDSGEAAVWEVVVGDGLADDEAW